MTALKTALAFATRGHPVLPLHGIVNRNGKLSCTCGDPKCENPGKHPYGRFVPNGLSEATTDLAKIRAWGSRISWLNWGVRTDKLLVPDIDLRKDGDETWRELEHKHGEVPLTWQAISGSGGLHVIFEKPPDVAIKSGNDKLGPGVDIKTGEGAYIVIAGSAHICGKRYEWSVDHHPSLVPLALPPQWMIDALAEPKRNGGNGAAYPSAKPAAHWLRIFQDGLDEGERDDTLFSLACHFLRRGVDAEVVHGVINTVSLVHCNPPKTDQEIERIVGSACRTERKRLEGIKK